VTEGEIQMMFRFLPAAAVMVAILFGLPAAAQAAPRQSLVRHYQCAKQVTPPVGGFLIRDTSHKRKGLFYRSNGSLTAGLFVGMGGDWVTVMQCKVYAPQDDR
jgi:hypothetical protein